MLMLKKLMKGWRLLEMSFYFLKELKLELCNGELVPLEEVCKAL